MAEPSYDYRDKLVTKGPILLGSGQNTRATQSFVRVLSTCWRRPSQTALEVLWRWLYGIPALCLIFKQSVKVYSDATSGTMDVATLGLDQTFLADPVGVLSANPTGVAGKIAHAVGMLLPGAEHAAAWLAPGLLLGWVVVSAVGRTAVLRRVDGTLKTKLFTLMGLHAIRVLVLAAVVFVWLRLLEAVGRAQVMGPIAAGTDPSLLGYCAQVIVISLGLFTVWGFVSWPLSVAPLLAMRHSMGVLGSLREALRLGWLKAKLAEINLVLAVVKIALVVLALTFSATPLPFESVATTQFLECWWVGVALLYILWSDFFHVARLVGYLELLRAQEPDVNNLPDQVSA